MITAGCAVSACPEPAVDGAPLCQQHLISCDAELCDALLAAWSIYELSQRTGDAADYQRCLLAVIRDLRRKPGPQAPARLRLVK